MSGQVREFVRSLPEGTIIVSGGAAGVDTWAAKAARKRGLKVVEHRAAWEALGDAAGPIRNTAIVEDADEVVAFWDGVSTGTLDTVRKAHAAGKPCRIVEPWDGPPSGSGP